MSDETERPEVHVGYYDSEVGDPAYDDAHTCPVCNESLFGTNREVVTILIYCTRWPLCTFLRFHVDEMPMVSEDGPRYHEIVADALFVRARIESEKKSQIPNVFRGMFNAS